MIVDGLDATLFCFADDVARDGLRQKMRLDHVAAFAVSDQAALAGNDRSAQLKLALETDAVLMASPGRNDHLCAVFVQPAHRRGILFADCFVGSEKCAIQVDRSQSIRELRAGCLTDHRFACFARIIFLVLIVPQLHFLTSICRG